MASTLTGNVTARTVPPPNGAVNIRTGRTTKEKDGERHEGYNLVNTSGDLVKDLVNDCISRQAAIDGGSGT